MNTRKEWLQWRHRGIGSSDAPIIHGESKYKTRFELGQEKLKSEPEEKETNYVQRIGNEMEPIARKRFAAMFNIENGTEETFEPFNMEMKDLPFMKASLDGWSPSQNVLVEFKFQSKPGLVMTKGKQAHLDVLKGIVRKDYWIQVQHQLLVSNALFAFFVSFDGETLNHTIIWPDVEFHKKHLALCVEFWGLVQVGRSQPAEYKEMKFKGAKAKAREWKQLKAAIDSMTKRMIDLKEEITSQATDPLMILDGIRITKFPGNKGSIDYVAALKSTGVNVDLEKFRKPDGQPYFKMEL